MKNKLLALGTLCLASSAFATNGQGNDPTVQGLSFEEIRISCQNPTRFHNQTAPSNIQVSCRDIQSKWIPDSDGTYSMLTARLVTSSVYSDKYSVSPQTAAVQTSPQVVACARFKEVSETVETIRSLSCDELVAFNGTSAEFCSAAVNSLRAVNVDAISSQPTGRITSLCAGDPTDSGPGQGRGQHGQQ